MKASLLGPTNLKKFSSIIGRPVAEIESLAEELGKVLAEHADSLTVVFHYAGVLKLVGDAYKGSGSKLEMLYTENDYDWDTQVYLTHLEEADVKLKKESWHDMLLSLVKDSDVVICAGLSAGVFAELGYMKWNFQEGKGKVKTLIGIKELLRGGEFPPEFSFDMARFIQVSTLTNLPKLLAELKP